MTVEEIISVMRLDPARIDVTGYEYQEVRKIETDIRKALYRSRDAIIDVEDIWRSWYGLRVQMLLDDIDVCPEGYQWDPLTLTC